MAQSSRIGVSRPFVSASFIGPIRFEKNSFPPPRRQNALVRGGRGQRRHGKRQTFAGPLQSGSSSAGCEREAKASRGQSTPC